MEMKRSFRKSPTHNEVEVMRTVISIRKKNKKKKMQSFGAGTNKY